MTSRAAPASADADAGAVTPEASSTSVESLTPTASAVSATKARANTLLVLACLLATWLIWGSTYLAIKWALLAFPPLTQIGSRFLCAGALLYIWLRLRGVAPPTGEQWRNALIVGGLMLFGAMSLVVYAEQSVGSGVIVVFIAVMPIMLALFNSLWGVWPTRAEWLGMVIGVAGVVWLASGDSFRASTAGLIAMCGAVTLWALGSALSQRRFHLAQGAMGFASEMLAGGALATLGAVLLRQGAIWPPGWPASLAWLYLVVFGSLIAFSAYMYLLAKVPAALASSYALVNPVVALALGISLGGESVTRNEWLACAVVLSGVLVMFLARLRPAARQD